MSVQASDKSRLAELRFEPDSVQFAGLEIASSTDPWLRIEPASALSRRRWVRLRYSLSYFDDPVRPAIRFATLQGRSFTYFMNGPVLGAGEWIGRVPDKTTAVSISPVNRAGRFDFRLDAIERVPRRELVRRGFLYDRGSLLQSFGAKLINAKEERWETLKFAASATAFEDYAGWHRRLYRPIDIEGFDRPRMAWRDAPRVRLILPLSDGSVGALPALLSSLQRQVFPNWSLHGVVSSRTSPTLLAAFRTTMATDYRIAECSMDTEIAALAPDLVGRDLAAVVELGGTLPDHALAVLADAFGRDAELRIAYGDEDAISPEGVLHSPAFKPDWSPVFFDHVPYLGRLAATRVAELAAAGVRTVGEFCRNENAALGRIAQSTFGRVRHLRRILHRSERPMGHPATRPSAAIVARSPTTELRGDALPEVAIIIPTRDRADLLGQCIDSLRRVTRYPRYKLVIVDNGSKKADALAVLKRESASPNCQVLRQPGPFNFSTLCNAGARAAQSPMLVFLNNDIVVVDGDWLHALVKWAVRPDVGVVGAKLLFPNNTIEHAGVVLGHGSLAGHIYHRQAVADGGYLGQLQAPREMGAVTGACIALERSKFDALGGFDENLKIEFNDIDLCLRAAERGWATVWTPHSMLYHLQSASRGYPLKPHKVFREERDYFLKRWAHVIRDDRYFHPALSLFSHKPALA